MRGNCSLQQTVLEQLDHQAQKVELYCMSYRTQKSSPNGSYINGRSKPIKPSGKKQN